MLVQKISLTLVLMLLFDSIYLYSIKDIFTKQIVAIQGSPLVVNIYGVVFCYIALVFGLYYFILRANDQSRIRSAWKRAHVQWLNR